MEQYVFVSYSRRQFYVAERLAASLRGQGIPTWLDVQEIDPGVDWQAAIMRGIEGCQAVVVVASRASYRSGPVHDEIAAAQKAGKPIYLAMVDDTPFVKELTGVATLIDCRSHFAARTKVLAQAIRVGDRRDNILRERRFLLPHLPFGFTKYVQLLMVNLCYLLGSCLIVLQKDVTVGPINPQFLPLVVLIGVPAALWVLSFGYSAYLLFAFRFQHPVTYTALDVWPIFSLFALPVLLAFLVVNFNSSVIAGIPAVTTNQGFSVTDRSAQDPLSIAIAIVPFIVFLLVYGALMLSSLRSFLLVFGGGLGLGVLAEMPIPTTIRYPLLLLLGGGIAYASMRGAITGEGVQGGMGGAITSGWAVLYPNATERESQDWGRWLTPGAFVNEALAPRKQPLRERSAASEPADVRRWSLHYSPADSGCAADIRRVFATYPSLQEAPPEQARYHLVVLSNRTPRKWLDDLAATYGQIICVVISAVDIAALAQPLHQNQWVDYRQQRPEQLSYLAQSLAGQDKYVNPTTPENLARPLGPYPVALVSHALRIMGVVNVVLGAAAVLLLRDSGLALFSAPQAALSMLVGGWTFWEAQRLRVRNTNVVELLVTSALAWLNLANWLISGSIVQLAPRAMLAQNGTYNQFLSGGFQVVAYFVGAPLGLLLLIGWIEFFRGFPTLARWLPRLTLPTWRRRLAAPTWGRLDISNVLYALTAALLITMLVVDSPYQFPQVREYDVSIANAGPTRLIAGSDGRLWFDLNGVDSAGYGVGYILPNGTVTPVRFLTPQPPACQLTLTSAIGNLPTNCYEGYGLQLGPDHDFWYATHMLFTPYDAQIVRVTPTGATTVFPLPAHSIAARFTFDAAGNLWFIKTNFVSVSDISGNIGRIDTAGHVTEFPAMANSQPTGIVAGPDGALWFADLGLGVIGRMTPAGKMTTYPLPVAGDPADRASIIAGGDRHVWFTDTSLHTPYSGVIGRISMDGVSQLFPQPPQSTPEDLVWGPDGALWFLDPGLNVIGRVAPDGATARYPLGAPIGTRSPLIVGRDGNLWCALDHQIARVTPSGAITRYDLPTLDATVTALVSAPDHHIWFVENTGATGLIGKLSP